MPDTPVDLLVTTISNTPSTTGNFTISTAATRASSAPSNVTFGASHDGLTFKVRAHEPSTGAWELRKGCTYTHSGTTLSRGTLEESSTGSAIDFTSAAIVAVVLTATQSRKHDAAALEHVAGSDANTTMAVNTLYVVDMSAWATADRTYTLPATAAVGDRVGVLVTAGNASFELLLTAASGDTLNGVAGGTEWSRVFITNECVIMRCVTANSAWEVEGRGRIPCAVSVRNDGTTTQSISATTFVKLQAALDAEDLDNSSSWDNSAGTFTARRAGNYVCTMHCQLSITAAGVSIIAALRKNGSDYAYVGRAYGTASGHSPGGGGAMNIPLAVGDTVEAYVYNSGTSAQNTVAGAERVGFSVTEVL